MGLGFAMSWYGFVTFDLSSASMCAMVIFETYFPIQKICGCWERLLYLYFYLIMHSQKTFKLQLINRPMTKFVGITAFNLQIKVVILL